MPKNIRLASFPAVLIGLSAVMTSPAVAQDMKVPIQKCASPVGSIAADTPTPGIWRTVGINDPAQFLVAIATESNCFTAAAAGTPATYRITATPTAKNEFDAGADRFSGRTALTPSELKRPKKMVWAHVAIMDSSGRAVAGGVGRNNTSKLDYSEWDSANRGVLSFNSDKLSRKYGGAMLNAFGDARATIENGLKGPAPQSFTQASSNGGGAAAQTSASAPSPSGPALSLEEATVGMRGNSPAFATRFKTPQRVKMKTYFGAYLERQGGKDLVYFMTGSTGYNIDHTASCFVTSSDPFFEQIVNLERGTPILVEGTFEPTYYPATRREGQMFGFSYTYYEDSPVVAGIGADDCRMTGTWDPFDRELIGGAAGSIKSLEAMFDERKENEFAFFRSYKDARVAISGAVVNISETDAGEIRVTLNDPRTQGFRGQLSCALPSSQANRAAALSVGKKATIVGTVQKSNSSLPIPFDLVNCELP